METCDTIQEKLIELVFGEPDEETWSALNEHLAGCEDCRAEEARLIGLKEGIAEAPVPTDELRERIRAALPKKRRGPFTFLRRPVPAYAAAAACLLVALVVRGLPGGADTAQSERYAQFMAEKVDVRFTVAGPYETAPYIEPHQGAEAPFTGNDRPPVDSL